MTVRFIRLHDRSTGNEVWVNLGQVLFVQAAGQDDERAGSILYFPANQTFVSEPVGAVMDAVREAVEGAEGAED